MKYYKVIKPIINNNKFLLYKYMVNWNLNEVIKDNYKTGYIVQKVKFINTTGIKYYKEKGNEIEFYETWKIENGINLDSGNECDDCFFSGEYYIPDNIRISLGKKGKIVYITQVYWISKKDKLYNIVDNWKSTISLSNGLKSIKTKKCPEINERNYLFKRENFIHHVDFVDEITIIEEIKKTFKMRYDEKDITLNEVIDEIFEDNKKYSHLKEILYVK